MHLVKVLFLTGLEAEPEPLINLHDQIKRDAKRLIDLMTGTWQRDVTGSFDQVSIIMLNLLYIPVHL